MHDTSQPIAWISREALLHNVRVMRRALEPGTRICAVLKADAYGHDANLVADALSNFQTDLHQTPAVDALAVATVEEADAIITSSLPMMILRPVENVFLGRQRESFELAIRNGWTLTLSTLPSIDDIARIALSVGKRASVQVMIDTGMSRCGVATRQVDEILERIESRPSLRLTGLCSHFSETENPASRFTIDQLRQFRCATDDYAHLNPGKLMRHAANSGAIFFTPQSHLDMVRPGLALYGIDPTLRPSTDRALKPVMHWTAPLLTIRDIKAGTPVGYNQTWKASRDTRIGLVPVGYADGYLRAFSNKAVMMVGGVPAPVIGRVSMDLVTIDLTHHAHASVGDQATVLDNDPLSPASVYALAGLSQTIPYEIFCHIGPRVKRVAFEPSDGQQRPIEHESDESSMRL